MLNELVGQYLKSADGGDLLKQLQTKGLSEQQATQAVTATAEGVSQNAPGAPGGMDLSGLVGGLLGGSGATAAGPMAGLAGKLAQMVAQKTGLAPAMAQTVVSMVLPKVMSLFGGGAAAAPGAATQAPSAVDTLKGLFR